MKCPKCGFENPAGSADCAKCGIVFSKIKNIYGGEKEDPGRQETGAQRHEKLQFKGPEKQCPYCMETVHAAAKKCKHCGEFFTQAPASKEIDDSISLSYFFAGIFDLSLKKMITPALVRANYAVFLILGGIGAGLYFITQVWSKPGTAFIVLLVYFLVSMTFRTWAEIMTIAFKIEANTRK